MRLLSIRARWATLDQSRVQRLAREGGWVIAGQIVTVLGALALVRVLTGYLAPAQYGELALGLTVAGLVNQMVMGGLNAGIGRFYSVAAEKHDLNGYLHASRWLMGKATIVVMAIAAALLTGLIWLDYPQWLGLTAATILFSILSGYNASLSGIQNAARQRAIVAILGGFDAWLKIALAVGIMLWIGSTSAAVVFGYVLSSLLVTGSQLFLLQRAIPRTGNEASGIDWKRQIWVYSRPFSIFGLFTWLHQASDRWALQTFSTTEVVGQYAVVIQLGYMPISVLTVMAISYLGPIFYQRSGSATDSTRNASVHRIAWRITWACFGVTALAFVSSLLLHEWVFQILVSSEYRSFSYLLPWMILAGGVFAAGQILALKLMTDMSTGIMATVKIGTALLGIFLNIYGALLFGVKGIVIAQVLFSVVYFGGMLRIVSGSNRLSWPVANDD